MNSGKNEFNKTYLSKLIERCIIKKIHNNTQINIHNNIQNNEIKNDEININEIKNNDESNFIIIRTSIVGPSFCEKTHLL